MGDTETRMMRYTIEQLSAELHAIRQYVCGLESKLDRTRKALDVAIDALKHYCTDSDNWSCVIDFTGDYDNAPSEFADKALAETTALTKGGDNE